jgi:ubiquinone/menaquinone biosynthesis C-methylase UbiE
MLDRTRREGPETAAASSIPYLNRRAEAIPAEDGACHVVLASLSLMYALDLAAAVHEIARVLSIDGQIVEVEFPLSVRSRQ